MGVRTVTLTFSVVLFLLGMSPSTQEPVLIKGGWNGRDDVTVERNVTKLTFGEKMLAGSLARVVAQTALHPLDVVRTRRQAAGVRVRLDVPTLLRGISPQALLSLPAGAIQFGALELSKKVLRESSTAAALRGATGAAGVDLIAGAVGALSASVVRVPQEVLKQGVQAGLYDDAGQAVVSLWAGSLFQPAPGVMKRFYRGFVATLSRDIPWNALSYAFFMAFRSCFQRLKHIAPTDALPPALDLTFGAAGGALAALLTHPIDVVKTRIMTAKDGAPLPGNGYVLAGIRELVAKEGPGVLGIGFLPRVVYLAPLASIVFAVFEAAKTRIVRMKVKTAVLRANSAQTPDENQEDIGDYGISSESSKRRELELQPESEEPGNVAEVVAGSLPTEPEKKSVFDEPDSNVEHINIAASADPLQADPTVETTAHNDDDASISEGDAKASETADTISAVEGN